MFPAQSDRFSGARRKVSGSSRLKSCGFAAMERKFRSKAERDNFCPCYNYGYSFPDLGAITPLIALNTINRLAIQAKPDSPCRHG
jgi:hypothetical protein